jgi:hypothetical protein
VSILHPQVTIASGAATSAALDCGGRTLCGVYLPSTFDGTALTFSVSWDGTNFFALWSGGAAYSVTVAASTYQELDPAKFAGVKSVKFTSGTNQATTDTILTAAVRVVG